MNTGEKGLPAITTATSDRGYRWEVSWVYVGDGGGYNVVNKSVVVFEGASVMPTSPPFLLLKFSPLISKVKILACSCFGNTLNLLALCFWSAVGKGFKLQGQTFRKPASESVSSIM
ncbi:unnamed protein product [Lathyrus sativus]|nr:unnamed protein product [Lathyrus sativus]